eukprot:3764916-Pyramimonas_sp.AAC.1
MSQDFALSGCCSHDRSPHRRLVFVRANTPHGQDRRLVRPRELLLGRPGPLHRTRPTCTTPPGR